MRYLNKDFFVGFLSCLCFILLLALTPVSNRYSNERDLFVEFINLFDNVQPRQWIVLNSTPNIIDLRDGETVYVSSTVVSQFTRINDKIFKNELIEN